MSTSPRSLRCALLFAFLGSAAPLHAQIDAEIAPLFGYYRPTQSFAPASIYYTSLPQKPSDLSGVAWGAEAHAWLGHRLGIAIQAAVANSTIGPVITPGGPRGPTHAQVVLGSAQLQYELLPSSAGPRIWVGAGPAFVRYGGNAYAEAGAGSPTSVGVATGIGLSIPIAPHLRISAGLETVFYNLDIPLPPDARLNPGSLESGRQADLLVHVGLALSLR